jgi:hypothetical protein
MEEALGAIRQALNEEDSNQEANQPHELLPRSDLKWLSGHQRTKANAVLAEGVILQSNFLHISDRDRECRQYPGIETAGALSLPGGKLCLAQPTKAAF